MFGNNNFYITDTDKEWVHETFEWLIKSYGYCQPDFTPILFTDEFFPNTIAHKQTAIEPLLIDLCNLFNVDRTKISFEIEADIRDSHGTPYEIQGGGFECELELIKLDDGYHYKLYFAKSLLKNPKRIVFNTLFQFIQINLSQKDTEWIGNEDYHFHFYLIGIYTGWGVILAQTMIDIGRETDGLWETSWKYVSPMPVPVMTYSMALHSSMIELKAPSWKKFLPDNIRVEYEKAEKYVSKNPNPVFNKQELIANSLFKEAVQQSEENNFDDAISTYQKGLFLTKDDFLRSTFYNNIGYSYLFKEDYQKSIINFQKALELNPDFAYAKDNIGFAFIMMGDLETGRHYLMLALESDNNEPSYTYRNMALYHQKRNEPEKARENFKKAFECITFPVDWLEYFYARFLYEQGEKKEALDYLQMAVDKGEQNAIEWMNEIKQLN